MRTPRPAMLLFLLLAPAAGAQNLVTNPGFEASDLPASPGYIYLNGANSTFMPGWTVGYDGVNEPSYLFRDTLYPQSVYEGHYSLELSDGDSLSTGVPTTPGVGYVWSFAIGGDDGGGHRLVAPGVDSLFFPARDGVLVGGPAGDWRRFAITFVASEGSSTLAVFDTPQGRPYGGTHLDAVRVVPCIDLLDQPHASTICPSSPAAFAAPAAGLGVLAYQWQIETQPDVWATLGNDPLPLACGGSAAATPPDSATTDIHVSPCPGVATYRVRCVISNACGSITSDPADLTICIADFNCSGGTPDDADAAAFFTAWNNGEDTADANASGGTPDDADIAYFFTRWNGGC